METLTNLMGLRDSISGGSWEGLEGALAPNSKI